MKHLFKIALLIITSTLSTGCANDHKSMCYYTERPEDELERLIMGEGDIEAYFELQDKYFCEYGVHKYLPFSLIMANTYKQDYAYYDVYFELMVLYRQNMDLVDEDVAEIMMKYLTKAMEMGNENAIKRYNDSDIIDSDTNLEKIRKIYNKFYK